MGNLHLAGGDFSFRKMKIALLLLVAFLAGALGQSLVVQTEYGPVKGRNLDNVANAWLGIRFAADPSGENRFRPPAAPEPWDFVMDCTRWGAACPQHCVLPTGLCNPNNQTEDCLNLNVFAPIGADSSSKLPVLFFIEGGAFLQ